MAIVTRTGVVSLETGPDPITKPQTANTSRASSTTIYDMVLAISLFIYSFTRGFGVFTPAVKIAL